MRSDIQLATVEPLSDNGDNVASRGNETDLVVDALEWVV